MAKVQWILLGCGLSVLHIWHKWIFGKKLDTGPGLVLNTLPVWLCLYLFQTFLIPKSCAPPITKHPCTVQLLFVFPSTQSWVANWISFPHPPLAQRSHTSSAWVWLSVCARNTSQRWRLSSDRAATLHMPWNCSGVLRSSQNRVQQILRELNCGPFAWSTKISQSPS